MQRCLKLVKLIAYLSEVAPSLIIRSSAFGQVSQILRCPCGLIRTHFH
jgi:hypothetical protein